MTQVGEMRMTPGGRWLPFRAEEELAVGRVGFVWRARFPIAPLLWCGVVDRCAAGEEALDVRLWGRVPLTRSGGADVARGQAIRYLAELAWVPQAMLANRELSWRELDATAVVVAARGAAVRLEFDAAGDLVAASTATRPRVERKRFIETPWVGRYHDYEVFDGVRIPTRAEAWWELPDGAFTYWRGTVTSCETA